MSENRWERMKKMFNEITRGNAIITEGSVTERV